MPRLINAEDLILLDLSKILGRPSKAISKIYFLLKVLKGLRTVLKLSLVG